MALTAVVLLGHLGRWTGLVFVAAVIAYVVFTYIKESRNPDEAAAVYEAEAALQMGSRKLTILTSPGIGGRRYRRHHFRALACSSGGAIELAASAGVSEAVIGLTVVAIGTSLPELVTAVIAALKKQGDVAFGNIIGSNIYNTFGILGHHGGRPSTRGARRDHRVRHLGHAGGDRDAAVLRGQRLAGLSARGRGALRALPRLYRHLGLGRALGIPLCT